MTGPFGAIDTAAGAVPVTHRLALVVEPFDAVARRGCPGVRAGREVVGRVRHRHRGLRTPLADDIAVPLPGVGRFVVPHTGATAGRMLLRLDDPGARFVPRRFELPLWTLAEVTACDTGVGAFIPAIARTVRPWLLPAAGYPAPAGASALRLRVARGPNPVRWPRVEAFGGPGSALLGWAHGDQHGQVLLVIPDVGLGGPPKEASVSVALRVHGPDPARAVPRVDGDALSDLPVETLPRPYPAPDHPVLRGLARPPGYVTAPVDAVRTLVFGRLTAVPDLPFFS